MGKMKKAALIAIAGLFCIASAARSEEQTVVQKDRKFSVDTLTIKSGDSLKFRNEDQVSHNLFSPTPGQSFDLKIQRPGQTVTHIFTATGLVDIRCAIHPQMKMQVTVTN
jgi:plastocyanin